MNFRRNRILLAIFGGLIASLGVVMFVNDDMNLGPPPNPWTRGGLIPWMFHQAWGRTLGSLLALAGLLCVLFAATAPRIRALIR